MKRTATYQLGYFEEGDTTSSIIEMQRWETLDAQLYALYNVLGNGVIEGWDILPSSGLSIVVAAGKGHVDFVAVESTGNITVSGLAPSTRNYVYAALNTTSYWDKSVSIVVRASLDYENLLYLGYVDTDETTIKDVNIDARVYLGFINLIRTLVSEHRHIGGDGNPNPINLASEVQGIINQNNLPDLDASIIKTGTLDQDRFPDIDHIAKLVNQGTLTHAQLDSFVESLSIENSTLMGETSTIDLLQLVLALKHVYPDIDKYLVNEIAYIPGISPDEYVDWDNTTAIVDTRLYSEGGQHTITGLPAPAKKTYTNTWDSNEEFSSGTYENVIIDANQVTLATQENKLVIDEFNDLSTWIVITNDLSSTTLKLIKDSSAYIVPPNSAKLVVGNKTVEISLVIKKEFDAMDWSQYGKLIFYLKTENVQHGDVFFYLNDLYAGTQNSHTKVLDRNELTVNVDTLQNGWQEIVVDISSYTRSNINTIGFYISSQDGWDTSKGFDLNVDNVYLTTGVLYKQSGYIREIFGGESLYNFWRLRWDAIVPENTGLIFKVRTRVGNNLNDLAQSIWSSYTSTSGSEIALPTSDLYKYIEIECYFESSDDYVASAILKKLYLDFYVSDIDGSFNYDAKDDWDSGSKFNIDTNTIANSISISKTDEINNVIYGTDGGIKQLDSDLNELYSITGSLLPRTTYQAKNNIQPSLGLITGVSRGNNGNLWISDVDNDRILELDKSGALITGFYGSFLTEPIDTYGDEKVTTTTTTSTLSLGASLGILQAIYNSSTGVLYVVFDDNLENIYDDNSKINIDKIYIKTGTQRIYLDDSSIELLGVDEEKYNLWNALNSSSDSSAKYIRQFSFYSHVLKITLNGANKTLFNYMVNNLAPSIFMSSPYEQEMTSNSVTVNFLVYNFEIGSGAGENGIKVTLDDGTPQIIYDTKIIYNGLSDGQHTVVAQLINGDGSVNSNIEAGLTGTFIVAESYSQPYVSISSPKPNQIYSSSPVVIDFDVKNFPILSTGQHVRYSIDNKPPVDYYSEDSIVISDLSAGKHTIEIYLVDKWGNNLGYEYGSVVGAFIIGTNSNALSKLYVDSGFIYDYSSKKTNDSIRIQIDVGNIYFNNIYSPIDIQVVPGETVGTGLPSLVIAKLRSPSWTDGLAGSENAAELVRRLANSASNTASVALSSIEDSELLYGTRYLDGHSVVQLDAYGNVIMSNNHAVFAITKKDAKTLLGSAEKIGDSEFMIGDAYNKRAIITCTDLDTEISKIEWQYDSDRWISDFHIVPQDNIVISIKDDSINESSIFIRQGTNIIWENNSASSVTIYSGSTTYDDFQLDPDLTLYGDEFESQVLQPGDRYSFKFVSVGEYNYFIYPYILTGTINVTKNRISENDQFVILENDGLESPFSSRAIKVDSWGNILWSFGEGYIVKPRDARPLLNNNVIIST